MSVGFGKGCKVGNKVGDKVGCGGGFDVGSRAGSVVSVGLANFVSKANSLNGSNKIVSSDKSMLTATASLASVGNRIVSQQASAQSAAA